MPEFEPFQKTEQQKKQEQEQRADANKAVDPDSERAEINPRKILELKNMGALPPLKAEELLTDPDTPESIKDAIRAKMARQETETE